MAAEAVGTAIVSGVASSVTESASDCIRREVTYVFKYQGYIDDLKNQVEQLGYKRERVERTVKTARSQGDEIYSSVEQWMVRVDNFIEEIVKPILEDEEKAKKRCFKGLCPNLITRYTLGKKAVKAAKDGAILLANGSFDVVSDRPVLRRTESTLLRGYENFDSRIPVLEKIMEALADANVNMIGVYGMGGVGKTTLVKKISWQVSEDNLFDVVVMAEVTQTPDLKTIQGQIADQLGLLFQEESEYGRADRLRHRLKTEKGRVLVILDDIWEKLDLDAVGIPFRYDEKGSTLQNQDWNRTNDYKRCCKILLTSRSSELCSRMCTQKCFLVDTLSYNEAKNLFVKTVGNQPEISDYQSIVIGIVRKCQGLPLAVMAIANALKSKSPSHWRYVLKQLEGPNPRCIPGMNETLYTAIELSYHSLKSEEAKFLFLLCGLIRAGCPIPVHFLFTCGMGLGLLDDVDTLVERRDKLHMLIDILKASCLLLGGYNNNVVRMHDVIHVVATSIASTDKHMLNIQNVTDKHSLKERLEEKKLKNSTAISLTFTDVHDDYLPEKLKSPKLELFHFHMKDFSLTIPDCFLERVKELKVLDLYQIRFPSPASSLRSLTNLRSMSLINCGLGDITIIGELKKLEILIFLGSDIKKLPKEIGELTRLKLLNLINCQKLKVISPNVISRLSQLEELYMGDTFIQWEVAGNSNQEPSNASIAELKQLSHLTALDIHIPDAQIMPNGMFYEKLERYNIFIGDVWNWRGKFETSRRLKLKISNSLHLGYGIKILLKRAEDLYLDELNGVKNVLYELDREGFSQLKHLHVQNGLQLLYIVNSVEWVPSDIAFRMLESLSLYNLINLEKICHGQICAESFSKLRSIKIENCDSLKHLFSISMSRNLSQLQELEVSNCKNLQEIFEKESEHNLYQNERNGTIIVFSELRSMTLRRLPKLKSFGFEMKKPLISQTSFPASPGYQEITEENEPVEIMALFSEKVVFPRLENLILSFIDIENMWLDQLSEISSFCQNLTSLTVENCSRLKFLFPHSVVKTHVHLQKLVIRNCKSMERVIDTEGLRREKKIVKMSFPKLLYMELKGLPNLTAFGLGDSVEFPLLKMLHIESCSHLKRFFSSSSCLETMREEGQEMNNIENCPTDILPLFDQKVAFPSLENMILRHLENIQLIWHNELHAHSFCKLKQVKVEFCGKLMTIVSTNTQGLTFQNLETLNALECWSMKSLFPGSIATGLLQLKNLWVARCGLEEIVSLEEGQGDLQFVFPQLIKISLHDLPKLKCFYLGFHTTEWPMLKELLVSNCPMIQIFGSQFLSFPKTDAECQSENSIQQTLFLFEKVAPNLVLVSLNSDDVKLLNLCQFSTDIFDNLKTLSLVSFKDEYVVLPFGFLQRFPCLDALGFHHSNFKELFPNKGVDEERHRAGFVTIKHLLVTDLPRLEHIWKDSQVHPFLTELRSLAVCRCQRLIYLMPSSASFENLTNLKVEHCNRLANILTCSTANSLVQLTAMKISYCLLVTQVLACEEDRTEEEIVFRKLKFLELYCLANLTRFCLANCTFEFPCLEEVIVVACPKLEIFSAGVLNTPRLKGVKQNDPDYVWKNDLNSTIQQMHIDMVGFLGVINLKVSEYPQLKEKWNDQLPVHLFCGLRSLVMDGFSDISSAIPHNLLWYLNDLKKLEVINCDSVREVFELEGQLNADGQIWKKSCLQILGFDNLISLKVYNCNSLRYIFTPFVILGLVQLERIEIRNCAAIEEIIRSRKEGEEYAANEKTEVVVVEEERMSKMQLFPKLYDLMLIDLPKLTRFCNFTSNVIELPSLTRLSIQNCPNIKSFISGNPICEDITVSKGTEEMNFEDCCADVHPLFDEKVAFPRLEDIVLSRLDKMQMLFHHQLHDDSFCKLQSLRVKHCEKIMIIGPSNILGRLSSRMTLRISDCASLEEVFKFQGPNIVEEKTIDKMLLSNLETLKLKGLPRLARFCNFNGNFIELFLSELRIDNCPSMKTFVSNFSSAYKTSKEEPEEMNSKENLHIEIKPLFDKKVRCPSLETLEIVHMDELRKIWDDKLSSDSFCKLTCLGVGYCNKLPSIIPSNMLRILQKLEKLAVVNCDSVEELFEVLEQSSYMVEETVNKEEAVSRFEFPSLTELELSMLPSLKSLYPGTCISEWPVLKILRLHGCNKVEIFASEFLCFQETHGKSQHEIPIPQPLFLVDKVAFPGLEELRLDGNDNMKEIWHGKFSEHLCGIKVLKLKKFLETDTSIPSCFFHTLPNLEKLVVSDAFFKEIFLCEGFCCDGKHPEAFSKLRDLKLSKLPELLYLWKEESQPRAFQNLESLVVSECGKVRKLSAILCVFSKSFHSGSVKVSRFGKFDDNVNG